MRTIRTDLASPDFARRVVFPLFHFPHPEASPDLDLTFIAGDGEHIQGVLLARPIMLCHRLELASALPPTARLSLSRTLMAFAQGHAVDRRFQTHGCLFQVAPTNRTMHEFAETLGGMPSPGSIYRIDHA